ncbi:ClpXP protease specificity-enhancing factor SspB [Azospirillum sp. TSO22-1]|uniref:SspB family protein n=1 Tax=Azospirillum sp. TSO22-1 TaxID=716789 RepID=UPI000D613827|nr:ClpXP protease specificity-enhancing factor SspB [Azospirillum sp. TSO22-1]PWC40599.1 hypothetical protein TSO221_24935 [Azospirillum sp. TSO22-1]
MAKEQLRYDKMVETALRGVVRDALRQVADRGLPGNHHFYLTFRTSYPGVDIPEYLHGQYPNEMTIVLQYQYYGLEIDEEKFAVTLSFNNVHERLEIPLGAITTFADPSVNFALQFQPALPAESAAVAPLGERAPHAAAAKEEAKPAADDEPKRGEVVTLDAFRKK